MKCNFKIFGTYLGAFNFYFNVVNKKSAKVNIDYDESVIKASIKSLFFIVTLYFFNIYMIMVKNYDRRKAVSYADKWALSANPDYYHFGGIGGDCTNFISQCLLAGGSEMNYNYLKGWYYKNSYDRSPSWTGVGSFMNFLLRKEESMGPFGRVVPLNQIDIGDILQLRQNPTHFNHSVIVTRIVGREIYVCAHTNDALNKPLREYFFYEVLPIHIEGIRKY